MVWQEVGAQPTEKDTNVASTSQLTGTLYWMPYATLLGWPHTVHSQLEGLFLSIASISGCELFGVDHMVSGDIQGWQSRRLGQFSSVGDLQPQATQLKPLVAALHNLFWELTSQQSQRVYKMDVTVAAVAAACNNLVRGLQQD